MVHPKFDLQSGEEKVTAWGGMRLMKEGLQRSGVSGWLGQVALQQPGSNRGYNPQVVVESCLVNIRMGCCRMSHTQVLRHDPTLRELFGWKQTPSASSYGRGFSTSSAKGATRRFFRF
jgi:hypothetical protein